MAAKYAKFDQGTPPPGYVDTEVILLTRDGVWLADDHEITHEPTRLLFARSLRKDETGYFLHIGREMKRIEVEDTAYFITGIDGSPEQGYELRISDGSRERLKPSTLRYRPGRLTCRIQDDEEAKFLSVPYMEILKHLEQDGSRHFLQIGGIRVELD